MAAIITVETFRPEAAPHHPKWLPTRDRIDRRTAKYRSVKRLLLAGAARHHVVLLVVSVLHR
jgi:hypothetical protein